MWSNGRCGMIDPSMCDRYSAAISLRMVAVKSEVMHHQRVMTQRDMMRELFRRFGGDRAQVVEAYAEAERRGEVERVRDAHDMSADEYASRLFADGVEKSWIHR